MVVDAAYARCLDLARRHYENFPVASRLLPRPMRRHVAAIYAFARTADDFADEGADPPAVRLARLDEWEVRLDDAVNGRAVGSGNAQGAVFVALADTMRRFELEPSLFRDLLSAFKQDVTTSSYETWDELLDYCRRSANPVGRLVLRLFGHRNPQFDRWSDDVCTALQLTNFWQDLGIDWARGRLYVPREVVRAAAADERDLDRQRLTPAWQLALSMCADRTASLFDRGRPIADAVRGRLRWELRATWLGGVAILDRLRASGFDVFQSRPALGWPDAARLGWRALRWRERRSLVVASPAR